MADQIKATPVKNKGALELAKAVQKMHEFASKPFGYQNPPGELLSELIGLPSVSQTLERIGYGEPLTTGAGGLGGTSRPRPEALEAAMAVAPLAQMTKGMPVGGSLKSFYSRADQAAKELPRTKGTGAEFMKELEKTKGVKPAEIQHRKLEEIKTLPKMTKEQFLEELDKRPPAQLEEKVLKQPSEKEVNKMAEVLADDEAKRYARLHAESSREEDYLFREEKERLLENEIDRLRNDARFELTSGIENKGNAPKYGEYTLPGGENYREILLKYSTYGEGTPLGKQVRALGYTGDLNDLSPRMLKDMGAPEKLISDWTKAIDTFDSSHFKEPNVIAHARVSDRVTPEGERVLHVEEIQSDWHQAGRKKGYKDEQKLEKEFADLAQQHREVVMRRGEIVAIPGKENEYAQLSKKESELINAMNKLHDTKQYGVPDAPFKKNWHELMMNRILADAAENGYDRVAISPGVVQAERYDLSNHVKNIYHSANADGTFHASVLSPEGKLIWEDFRASPEKIEETLGKDIAQKIVNGLGVEESGMRRLDPEDMKMGGEGMKGFYDKMLPDYLNSLGKKYGVQVDTMPIRTREAGDKWVQGRDNPFSVTQDIDEPFEGMVELSMKMPDGTVQDLGKMTRQEADMKMADILAEQEPKTNLHSFKITPEMRQEFTEKGFPMYSIAAPVGLGATQIEQPVQITDNPDAMMMELGDKEFAGGGIIKRLARAPAKSKQEIEAIAERIAPQVTGEFVRKPKETQSVAGKTQKQFAREKDLPVEFTDVKNMPKVEVIDPEQLKGMVVTGVPGDPSVTGKSLVRVGDIKLDSPSPQHGGPLYGLGRDDDIFWASGIDPAGRVQSVAKEAMQAYDAPVAGQYIMMGPDSINYAQHFADANLSAIDLSKMSKRQIEEFNKLIRFGNAESGPRPSFPGIENKEDAYLHFAFDPSLRKHFNAVMQMPTVTERFNLPSGQDIRFAITEEPLRNLETGVTGYSMGRLAPEIPKSALPLSEHPTYSHDIPGQFMGGLKYPTPYELSFPDTLKSVMEHPRQQLSPFGSLKYVGPRQIYDQQMVDELKMYEEAMKKLTGKKAGGVVTKDDQGLIKVKNKRKAKA